MSVKRSRNAARSSGSGSGSGVAGVANRPSSSSPDSPELRRHLRSALASPSAPPPPPPAGILTLSSPGAEDSGQERIGNFLEGCCYCQKMIGESDEVFMYGHLRAFCTADCRERQVAMDKLREKRPMESTKVRGGHTAG